jgi:hypothetical protein
MGIQINGVNDIISATDGSLSLPGADLTNLSQVNVTGVGTFANLVVTGNVSIAGTLTYEDVTNVDSIGIVTARSGVRIDAGGIVVVGVTTVAAGTAALPSISPTGDSDTGIFFPSADTIAFGEGGAEAARFDSSGRFGIGTSTPGTRFHIAEDGDTTLTIQSITGSGQSPSIRLQRGTYGADGFNDVRLYNTSGALLVDNIDSAGAATNMLYASTTGVAIGSSSPDTNLTVYGANNSTATAVSNIDVYTTTAYAQDVGGSIGLGGYYNGSTNISFANIHGKKENGSINNAAGYFAISTRNNITGTGERVRIDSSGKLLVGTSSASAANAKIQINSTSEAFGTTGTLAIYGSQTNQSSGSIITQIIFGADTASGSGGCKIAHVKGGDNQSDSLAFFTGTTSPTERLRIANDGAIYTQNGAYIYGSNNGDAPSSFPPIVLQNTSNNTTVQVVRFRGWDGSESGSITTRVNLTAYNTSSDYRIKENIQPLTGAIDRINQLQVRRFNFINDPDYTVDGFIAHEAQAVVPECVTGEKDAINEDGSIKPQGIDQSKLVPLLTAALQEAVAKIESLEARLTAAGI